jgi:hypothetical protein
VIGWYDSIKTFDLSPGKVVEFFFLLRCWVFGS